MSDDFSLRHLVKPYQVVEYVHLPRLGYIVWRLGTGGNIELLHIKAFKKNQGIGKKLFIEMLKKILENNQEPYHSIFGFTRTLNEQAHNFYSGIGFSLAKINGIYADGSCVIFSQDFKKLIAINFSPPHNEL